MTDCDKRETKRETMEIYNSDHIPANTLSNTSVGKFWWRRIHSTTSWVLDESMVKSFTRTTIQRFPGMLSPVHMRATEPPNALAPTNPSPKLHVWMGHSMDFIDEYNHVEHCFGYVSG